jgi:rhomboid protease GluP
MPHHSLLIPNTNIATENLLPIAFAAFQELQWKVKFAGDEMMIGYTPRSWKRYEHEIKVELKGDQLEVTSTSIHGGAFDIYKVNKKHTEEFQQVFERQAALADEGKLDEWRQAMQAVTEETIAEQKAMKNVLNPHDAKPVVAIAILVINALLFIVMVASGVPLMNPDADIIFKWGGNYGPVTMTDEPWRLLTSVFVHIGVIHILFNSYALYIVSVTLEPMLGKLRFLAAYLCTGVLASLASVWWHADEPLVSAGASGAIFGLFGVILALLSTKLIPREARASLFQGIGVFVLYNLLYGLKSKGVDNAAHIGGLLAGLAIGYLYYFQLKKEVSQDGEEPTSRKTSPVISVALLLLTAILILGSPQLGLFNSKPIQTEEFSKKVEHFSTLEQIAMEAYVNKENLDADDYRTALEKTVLPNWVDCINLMNETAEFHLNDKQRQLGELLKKYASYRVDETLLMIRILKEEEGPLEEELETKRKQINTALEEISTAAAQP